IYKVNNGTPQSSNILTGLKSGSHIILVEDSNHCKQTKVVNLTQPAKLIMSKFVIINPTCDGYKDGTVTITPKGGTPPYSYVIDQESPVTTTKFDTLGAGTYTFRVIDANGCYSDTTVTLIGLPPIIVHEIIADDVKCYGSSDGKITVTATGGV